MTDQRVHKSVSGACGLTGFAVAIFAGLAADNPAGVILSRALIAMVACYAVGIFLGMLALRAVRDATALHATRNPAPDVEEVRQAARHAFESGLEAQQAKAMSEAA